MKKIILTAAMLGAVSLSATTASAEALALSNFNTAVSPPTTVTSCLLCHNGTDGSGGALNSFGVNFKDAGGTASAYIANYTTLGDADADNNGIINSTQINNGDAPAGNGTLAAFTVPATTTTAATSSSSDGGCVTSSATTPLMMVLAMLALGFFVRRKKS